MTRTQGRRVAVLAAAFDGRSLALAYVRSENLGYSSKSRTVNSTYNRWVAALARAIEAELGTRPANVATVVESRIGTVHPTAVPEHDPPDPDVGGYAPARELLLFGGPRGHHVFLGCLTCGPFDASSICSRFGDYGSRYAATSIWNPFEDYGSRFSDTSPWNRYAADPASGSGQGRKFLRIFHVCGLSPLANENPLLRSFLDDVDDVNDDLDAARDAFCAE